MGQEDIHASCRRQRDFLNERIASLTAERDEAKRLDRYEIGYQDGESSATADLYIALSEPEDLDFEYECELDAVRKLVKDYRESKARARRAFRQGFEMARRIRHSDLGFPENAFDHMLRTLRNSAPSSTPRPEREIRVAEMERNEDLTGEG